MWPDYSYNPSLANKASQNKPNDKSKIENYHWKVLILKRNPCKPDKKFSMKRGNDSSLGESSSDNNSVLLFYGVHRCMSTTLAAFSPVSFSLGSFHQTRVCLCLGRCKCGSCTWARTIKKSIPRPPRRLSKQTLDWFIFGEDMIQPRSDPTAERTAHFWTKPATVVRWAVHLESCKSGIFFFFFAIFCMLIVRKSKSGLGKTFPTTHVANQWCEYSDGICVLLHFGSFYQLFNWVGPVQTVWWKRELQHVLLFSLWPGP